MIGTGASAIQFVPQIQPRVGRLHLFQRTAPWIMPRPDRPLTGLGAPRCTARCPRAQLLMRAGIYWARESFVLGFRHPRVMRRGRAPRAAPPAPPGPRPRAAAQAHADLPHGLQARAHLQRLPAGARARERRGRHRRHPRGPRALDRDAPTAPSARSTRSSSPPASTSPTCRPPSASAGATGARWPRSGTAARRPTWARWSPAARTSSSWSAPTPAWGTTRSSS